ncbi:LOW QUALITY PROTEIN: DNA repair protein Rad7 [Paramyrothecium foliicola]|nr:LOW QUALITY PROTEIN: DNA repair protein Rad7 [Paramyrothecium foliicola]
MHSRARQRQNQSADQSTNQSTSTGANGNQNENAGRPQRPVRHITGPQIRDDAHLRRQQAATQTPSGEAEVTEESVEIVAETTVTRRRSSQTAAGTKSTKKRAEEQKAIEKIKASKSFKKRKKGSDDEDEIAQAIFQERHAPLPGQMENCEICDKRFTVTPYSVAGPNGGLLCAPCGREIAKERAGQQPKKKPRKQVGGVGSRRAAQSRILDGDVGAKSLATLCVQTLAKNVHMADSLGDLPEHLIDKIARIFSKRRLLRPETLPLFAQPHTETLHIYDGANLGEQDLMSIFQVAPNLRRLKLRSAVQFKDNVMDYLLSRDIMLESFSLSGANLLSDDKWHEFLIAKGKALKGVQVYYTDNHFGDETLKVIQKNCPSLTKLKVEHNQKVTSEGVKTIADMTTLKHLGLQLQHSISSQAMVHTINGVGTNLETLSLTLVPNADDSVLDAIHEKCRALSKLRITDSEEMTDAGFQNLFTNWENPPLTFLDLQKCRHLDSTVPRNNPDSIGLCSEGFKALMAHSGSSLQILNIHACRHISREAFEEVFSEHAEYPMLKELEISFCEEVTDFILGSIFRSCPSIKEINVFGCMKVKEVRVPRGVILVGVPNAQGMLIEGVHDKLPSTPSSGLCEALLELLCLNSLLVITLGASQLAVGDLDEVVLVRGDVERDETLAVAVSVGNALADADLASGIVELIGRAGGQPVLGRGVTVAKDDWGQTWHGVLHVGQAVLGASLGRDKVDKLGIANARGAVGVHVGSEAVAAEVSSADGGDSSTERVAGQDQTEAWVGGEGSSHGGLCLGVDLFPSIGKAFVKLAVAHEVAVFKVESEVGDPVEDVVAAADSDNNFLTSLVDADITSNARKASPTVLNEDSESGNRTYFRGWTMVAASPSSVGHEPLQVMRLPAAACELQYAAADHSLYSLNLLRSAWVTPTV